MAAVTVAPVAERRITTILFGDLVGFSALSETRDPEEVRELLSRYFAQCRVVIGRYGGSIEKFIGDAVMAVWGVPVTHEDDAERAVRAGLELVEMVSALGDEVAAPALSMRVGLVTGEVAVTVGAQHDGMVAGDAVNTAARVQSTAAPGQVWVDDTTRSLTVSGVAYEDAGTHTLKGKAEPVHLSVARAVVAELGGGQRVDGLEAPHIGRDRSLRLLKELFHSTEETRRPRLVVVDGEPGVGKSRLVWEFEKYIDGLHDMVRWHRGRCLSYGDGVAFWALTEAVRARAGLTENDGVDVVADRLDACLERFVPDASEREWLRPRVAGLVGVAQTPGAFSRDDLFAAWTTFFERVGEGTEPVVLVIDDAHHADVALLDFLDYLMATARFPMFVVVLARPELLARRHDLGGRRATILRLEPLDDGSMRTLVDGLVHGLSAEVRDELVSRAEGIPLFAVETVRALIDRDAVVPQDGRYVPAPGVELSLEALGAPASLQALVASRLDSLSPEERRLVADAAVLGQGITRGGLAALSAFDDIDSVLEALQRKEILRIQTDPLSSERGQFRFVQAVVRQVAYSTQSRRDRKQRHVTAADYLETQLEENEDLSVVIAQHLLDAVDSAASNDDQQPLIGRAVSMLERAARRAASLGAPSESLRLVQAALDRSHDDTTIARLSLAGARSAYDAGQNSTAIELAEAAATAFDRLGMTTDASVAVAVQARVYGATGDNSTAIAIAEKRLDLISSVPGTEVARLQLATVLAWSHMSRGDNDVFAEYTQQRVLLAEALLDRNALAHAYLHLGVVYSTLGASETGLRLYRLAADIAREEANAERLAHALGNMSSLLLNRDLDGALVCVEDALEAGRRSGSVDWIDLAGVNRANVLWVRGDLDRLHTELLDLIETVEDATLRPALIGHAIKTARALDRDLPAVEVDGMLGSDDVSALLAIAHQDLLVAETEGRAAEALSLADRIVSTYADKIGLDDDFVMLWVDCTRAALALGAGDRAAALLQPIATAMPGRVTPLAGAVLCWLRGRVRALLRDDPSLVEADLRAGVAALDRLGARVYQAWAHEDLGDWLLTQGRHRDAEDAHEAALTLYDAMRATGWLRDLQERLSLTRVDAAR